MGNPQIYRAWWHDYRSRAIYMITLSKSPGVPAFGALAGDWSKPVGSREGSFIRLSPLGKIIKNTLFRLHEIEPAIRLLQYSVMPDHVHFLIFVQHPTAEALGYTIARLKVAVNKAWKNQPVFTEGYNDRILKSGRKLDTIFRYIRENPYRLAIRKAFPDYFHRINLISIAGRDCQAYGNLFLLRNPFKDAVVVHRKDTEETKRLLHGQWLYTASNGGVLVSPFISPAEKAIRREAEEAGGKFILIQASRFPERYKPAAHDFSLCMEGRLLIITLALDIGNSTLSRSNCLSMNELAQKIASCQD